jgi:hypothetical protein
MWWPLLLLLAERSFHADGREASAIREKYYVFVPIVAIMTQILAILSN